MLTASLSILLLVVGQARTQPFQLPERIALSADENVLLWQRAEGLVVQRAGTAQNHQAITMLASNMPIRRYLYCLSKKGEVVVLDLSTGHEKGPRIRANLSPLISPTVSHFGILLNDQYRLCSMWDSYSVALDDLVTRKTAITPLELPGPPTKEIVQLDGPYWFAPGTEMGCFTKVLDDPLADHRHPSVLLIDVRSGKTLRDCRIPHSHDNGQGRLSEISPPVMDASGAIHVAVTYTYSGGPSDASTKSLVLYRFAPSGRLRSGHLLIPPMDLYEFNNHRLALDICIAPLSQDVLAVGTDKGDLFVVNTATGGMGKVRLQESITAMAFSRRRESLFVGLSNGKIATWQARELLALLPSSSPTPCRANANTSRLLGRLLRRR